VPYPGKDQRRAGGSSPSEVLLGVPLPSWASPPAVRCRLRPEKRQDLHGWLRRERPWVGRGWPGSQTPLWRGCSPGRASSPPTSDEITERASSSKGWRGEEGVGSKKQHRERNDAGPARSRKVELWYMTPWKFINLWLNEGIIAPRRAAASPAWPLTKLGLGRCIPGARGDLENISSGASLFKPVFLRAAGKQRLHCHFSNPRRESPRCSQLGGHVVCTRGVLVITIQTSTEYLHHSLSLHSPLNQTSPSVNS